MKNPEETLQRIFRNAVPWACMVLLGLIQDIDGREKVWWVT